MAITNIPSLYAWETAKQHIYRHLLGSAYNSNILEKGLLTVPLAGDLVVAYAIRLPDELARQLSDEEHPTAFAYKTMIDNWEISEQDLEHAAKLHDKEYQLIPMNQVLFPDLPDDSDPNMMIITNQENLHGAGGILSETIQAKISNVFPDGGAYCLPSSRHEWILTARKSVNPEELMSMVREINNTVVMPKDRLSDHVFMLEGRKLTAVI